jgi:hypothetical protein
LSASLVELRYACGSDTSWDRRVLPTRHGQLTQRNTYLQFVHAGSRRQNLIVPPLVRYLGICNCWPRTSMDDGEHTSRIDKARLGEAKT